MEKEPDLIISIGGKHPAKSVLSGLIANALNTAGVTDVSHLNFDDENFATMKQAISESVDNNLKGTKIVILEWGEDDDSIVHAPQAEIE